jgi:hypothetical protein
MKRIVTIIFTLFSFLFISCNPFDEKRVLNYSDELNELVLELEEYENGTYDRDEIDEFIIEKVRNLDINNVVINKGNKNRYYSGFIEENDSLIIFIKNSNNMFDNENRIIYDFNPVPRNFGSDNIELAAYKIVQLNDRWYYSEVGFD